MTKYSIVGAYPSYAITRNGVVMDSFSCNTLEQADELIKDLEDDYEIRGQSDLLMWREYNDWHIKV